MSSVRELISSQSWDALTEVLQRGEDDDLAATSFDQDGMNNFHRICRQQGVPGDIIKSMVRQDRRNLVRATKSPCTPLGPNKYTPLHIACESGSVETVRILLELLDQQRTMSDQGEDTCLKDFVSMVCGSFNLLTCVWGPFFAPDVAYATRMDSVRVDDEFNEEDFVNKICSNIVELTTLSSIDNASDGFRRVWEKTMLLLRVAHFGSTDKQYGQTLHMVAGNGGLGVGTWSCPSIVMFAALKLYPEQVCQKDKNGNLPLHIAAASPYHDVLGYATWKGNLLSDTYTDILFQTRVTATTMLLDCFPQAAAVTDGTGRLPLNLAIESGKYAYTIEELIHAAPEALDARDPGTHLFRFMLAAAQDASVDNIYTLLRGSPNRVEGGIPFPNSGPSCGEHITPAFAKKGKEVVADCTDRHFDDDLRQDSVGEHNARRVPVSSATRSKQCNRQSWRRLRELLPFAIF